MEKTRSRDCPACPVKREAGVLRFVQIGSVLALVLILVSGVVQGQVYPEVYDHLWQTYVASFTMPIIGFVIGFVLAWIFCLKLKQRLAIGFETGIQNTALALTVVAITFPTSWESSYYSQFIILYTTFQASLNSASCHTVVI
jgi:predicted Na+-dependent transporter